MGLIINILGRSFIDLKKNTLPLKTENGEYMTYDQYAYERDKLLKEYYTDFWTDGTLYADWSQFFYSIFGFTISPQIWQALGYIAVGIGFTASGVFSYPQIFLECFLNSLSQIFVGTYFRIFDNIPNFVWMVLNCFYESFKVVFFTLINCREIYFSTIRILENLCSMIQMIFNSLLSIIIKVYITISKLLLFGKENMACYKKELKHEIKSLEKVKVQKSIRKRFDNIHKKFEAFINKKIRKQLNLSKVFCKASYHNYLLIIFINNKRFISRKSLF